MKTIIKTPTKVNNYTSYYSQFSALLPNDDSYNKLIEDMLALEGHSCYSQMYQFPSCIIDNLRNCDAGHKKYKPQYLDSTKLAKIRRLPIQKNERGEGSGRISGGDSIKKNIFKKSCVDGEQGVGKKNGLGKSRCFTEVSLGGSGVSPGLNS
jgi:hypothetical protein